MIKKNNILGQPCVNVMSYDEPEISNQSINNISENLCWPNEISNKHHFQVIITFEKFNSFLISFITKVICENYEDLAKTVSTKTQKQT